MARDRFLPNQFTFRGDRLAFTTGIVVLGLVVAGLVLLFGGSEQALIPLFALGVFLSFTLSQAGMVVHHWRLREPHWQRGLLLTPSGRWRRSSSWSSSWPRSSPRGPGWWSC